MRRRHAQACCADFFTLVARLRARFSSPPAATRILPPKQAVVREGRGAGPKVVKILKFSKSGNHRAQVKKITVMGNMRIAAGGELKRARKRVGSIKKTSQQS